LGDRLLLRVLRETDGIAGTASEDAIRAWTLRLATETGIDAAPEGGCALSVLRDAMTAGTLSADSEVVVFNTGSGASYRA
jgi:threonine synthase